MNQARTADGGHIPGQSGQRPSPLGHDALAASLAAHLRAKSYGPQRVTWENLSFSDWSDPQASLHCRPDVFSIVPSLDVASCRPWTHEIKVSRADFLSDIRSGKWRQYMAFSCRVFFAAPAGMISVEELPKEAGLWEFDNGKWETVKTGTFCKGWSLPPRHLMKLILGRWGTFAHRLPEITKADAVARALLLSKSPAEGGEM